MSNRLHVLRAAVTSLVVGVVSLFAVPMAMATPLPTLSDQALQSCLDEAVKANGWSTTEDVISLSCVGQGVQNVYGLEIFTNLSELDLSGNQFSAASLDSIYMLQSVRSLDLSGTGLSSFSMSRLPEIEVLKLGGNLIRSFELSSLSNRLIELDISDNSLSNLNFTHADTTTRLKKLDISGNSTILANLDKRNDGNWKPPFYQLMDYLKLCPELTHLNIGESGLVVRTDGVFTELVSVLKGAPKISNLSLAGIEFSDAEELSKLFTIPSNLTNLVELNLSGTGLKGKFSTAPMEKLEVLNLSNNELKEFSLYQILADGVRVIDLSNNKFTSYPYPSIKISIGDSLEKLDLTGNDKMMCNEIDELVSMYGTKVVNRPEACTGESYVLGDVNHDGKVDIVDALEIARFYVGIPTKDPFDASAADWTGDGKIDIDDSLEIARWYVNS